MSIIKRASAETPPFFKKIRKWGLVIASVSATVLAAPVALPAIIVKVAGYVAVAGAVASAVSQTATNNNDAEGQKPTIE